MPLLKKSAVLFLLITFPVFSQGFHHGLNPDSLNIVTLSGTAIVDTNILHPIYYLDENGDGDAEYYLDFGPFWYQPDSSLAERPQDGDFISITGGMYDSTLHTPPDSLPEIVVYEINGEFWRDPYMPLWGILGQNPFHNTPNGGFSFGWRNDTLVVVEKTGVIFVDSTFIFNLFYLDENADSIPDYFLNFGPPWYEPVDSTLDYPSDGDTVTVSGALVERGLFSVIIVFELNGKVWLDSSQIKNNFGGRWIHKNMIQNKYIHAPFDSGDGFTVSPGWHNGMGPVHMLDSLFCQIIQLFPQNMPEIENENAFAGYEIGIFNSFNINMLIQNQHIGGTMQFAQKLQYQFHYNDIQILGHNIDESSIKIKTWNPNLSEWQTVDDAVVDINENTISYESKTVSSLIIISGDQTVTNAGEENILVNKFELLQNFPNPFNPITSIKFNLKEKSQVELSVYNVLGQKIDNIYKGSLDAGKYTMKYDAMNLPSGVYFYELKTSQGSLVKKMTLLK